MTKTIFEKKNHSLSKRSISVLISWCSGHWCFHVDPCTLFLLLSQDFQWTFHFMRPFCAFFIYTSPQSKWIAYQDSFSCHIDSEPASPRIEGSPSKEWLWTVAESKRVVTHINLLHNFWLSYFSWFHIFLSPWHSCVSKCKDLLHSWVHFCSLSFSI